MEVDDRLLLDRMRPQSREDCGFHAFLNLTHVGEVLAENLGPVFLVDLRPVQIFRFGFPAFGIAFERVDLEDAAVRRAVDDNYAFEIIDRMFLKWAENGVDRDLKSVARLNSGKDDRTRPFKGIIDLLADTGSSMSSRSMPVIVTPNDRLACRG